MTEEIKADAILNGDGEANLNSVDNDITIDNETVDNQAGEEKLPEIKDTLDTSIDVKDENLGYDFQGEETVKAEVPAEKVISNISERLSNSQVNPEAKVETPVAEPKQTIPFDINSLSTEQVQALKQILASTPESAKKKKAKPTTKLRKYKDSYVVAITKSYMRLRKNTLEGRDEIAHYLGVKCVGEKDFTEMNYSDFMGLERAVCEITSVRYEDKSYVEGEVTHRDSGKLVERLVTVTLAFYTVKLPNGELTEIEGSMSNL